MVQPKIGNNPNLVEEDNQMEWSVDQEILLLYSLHGHKPVGMSKYFQMILIQERLSNAMNRSISTKDIWEKLNTLYDLEALDEAEAEADAANTVTVDFSLPEEEFGDIINDKISGRPIKFEKLDSENDNAVDNCQLLKTTDAKTESESIQMEVDSESEAQKGTGKDVKKEMGKRGPKKKEVVTPVKETPQSKKDTLKETPKKDVTPINTKEVAKDSKKSLGKEDKKDDIQKRNSTDLKKDLKEEKKESLAKLGKRESIDKRNSEQVKKETEVKKGDQKKIVDEAPKNQRELTRTRAETPKQLRNETPKRNEGKPTRSETPKSQKIENPPKPSRVEALKKDVSSDKKGEKSPEKTPDPVRGTKLRNREKKEESETPVSATKRERSRDSNSKTDVQEETPVKRSRTPIIPKGRATRNSIEPQTKPASPVVNPTSPLKRRTRIL